VIRAECSSFWMSSIRVELALWLNALPKYREDSSQKEDSIG